MKINKKSLCVLLLFVVSFSGCVDFKEMDCTKVFVVLSVEPQIIESVNSDHNEYNIEQKVKLRGYLSNWRGDMNNSAAIYYDRSLRIPLYCYTKDNCLCDEIKKGDVLSLKADIFGPYEIDNIVGNIYEN